MLLVGKLYGKSMKTAPLYLCLLLLTACKTAPASNATNAAEAQAEALEYTRLVGVAVSNAYYESGKPVPPTPCTDPLFGMKKTSNFLKLERCTARKTSADTFLVAAVFNGDLAVLGDEKGTRIVKVSELPEVK